MLLTWTEAVFKKLCKPIDFCVRFITCIVDCLTLTATHMLEIHFTTGSLSWPCESRLKLT